MLHYILHINSFFYGHMNCFYPLAIVNNAAKQTVTSVGGCGEMESWCCASGNIKTVQPLLKTIWWFLKKFITIGFTSRYIHKRTESRNR